MPRITMTGLTLVSLDRDEDGTAAVHFLARRPMAFTAGQHGVWLVPGGGIKRFSIASAPEEELLTIGTTLHDRSRFERALGSLHATSTVHLLGPFGSFTLEGSGPSVVMLAQGMGITPFRSMLRHETFTGSTKRVSLVHVDAHHPFRSDTEPAATSASYPTSRHGFEQDVAVAARRRGATFLISGSAPFVQATTLFLEAASVPASQIRRDVLHGHSQPTTVPRRSPLVV